MAANVSTIGKSTRVRGRVTGDADLDVQGFVDGEIVVGGDVTVDTQGMVGAGIRGRRLVVRGAVKGDLHGEEAIVLEDGARVVGDLRAPRVAIAPGALVRGFVETGDAGGASARPSRTQTATRPAASSLKVAAPPPKPAAAPAKSTEKTAQAAAVSHAPPAPRRPPPPIVPALKKAKGQIAKKKER